MGTKEPDRHNQQRDFTYYFVRFVGALNVLALAWFLTAWFPWS